MARKTVEITASFTGVIPTGNYENEKPLYSITETIELEDGEIFSDDEMRLRLGELHEYCYAQFKQRAEVAYQEKIAETYQNIRFYPGLNGTKYPSVTSIIGWDEDFHISPEELAQYAARGSIIDKQVEVFLLTGEWKEPKDIPEVYPDLVILKNGSLGLSFDDVDFRAFYKEYPFKVIECQKVHINHEHKYGGRSDIKCVIESANPGKWSKIEGVKYDVPVILDVKTGAIDKTKMLKQQTAYWKTEPDVQMVGLIPLNKDTKQGYSQPIIETNPDRYWSLFLKDREDFRKRYGV